MYRDEQFASSLAKVFDEYDEAMIDTCSMMEEAFPNWLEIYEKSKKYALQFHPLIVLKQCYQELKRHSKGKIDDKKRAAKLALEILKTAKKNKTIAIVKYKNRIRKTNFGDHAIFSKVNDDHLDFRVLVITQDKKLTTDLLKLNNLSSQFGKPVVVMKITQKGELIPNRGVVDPSIKSKNNPTSILTKKEHPLVISDRRLSAVIGNPNYPQDRKVSDVRAQLSALSKTDPKIKKGLTLNYSEDRLQTWLSSNAPSNKPVVRKEEPHPIVKREEPKPAPVKTEPVKEAPKVESKPSGRVYTGKGKDERAAFTEAALNAGIIVRDAGVPYVPVVHGPTDIDAKSLTNFLQNYEKGGKKPTDFKNLHVEFEKEEGKVKANISFLNPPKQEVKKVVEDAPKPAKAKPVTVAPKVKVEPKPEPKKEEKKVQPKPSPKKEKAKPAPKQKEPAKEPILIVAVPEDPKVAEKKEKEAAKPAKPNKVKAEKKAKKEESAPKEEAKKPEPKKQPKAPAKKEAPKDASPKKAEPKKGEPAKEAPKKQTPKHTKLLEQVKQSEARLMAVLPNPTYSTENKIKDIQTQLVEMGKLSKQERATLRLDTETLKSSLRDLQNQKKD